MAEKFYTLITTTGKAKMANAAALGTKVNFKTLKLGDGNGGYYEPSENQTDLVNKVWEGNIGSISTDEQNSNWIVAKTTILATYGGFFIREAGIFDEDGDLIAIAKMAETYKPVNTEGSTKDLIIKIILEISNINSIMLTIDPNIEVATQEDIELIHEQIEDIKSDISNDIVITPAVNYGMNSVIKLINEASKFSIVPKFTIQGKTLINLLGKDGNCEDISKWTSGNTMGLDSTNRVYGNNSIKCTLVGTNGGFNKAISSLNLNTTKYYLISAYLKNGNASDTYLSASGSSGDLIISNKITDSTKFNRVGIILQPSDWSSITNIVIRIDGTVGQYAYCDGIMINEITSDEYTLGADALLTKYPYVDSYTCLQNPYIEVRHDNLVRNGNGEEGISWWNDNQQQGDLFDGTYFNVFSNVADNSQRFITQSIPVKANTSYSFGAIAKAGTNNAEIILRCYDKYGNGITSVGSDPLDVKVTSTTDTNVTGTINTPSNAYNIQIYLITYSTSSSVGKSYFKNIMLVEGITAPTSYKSCSVERVVLETKLTSDDSISYENGEVTGLINWKHKTLYGKDYDWGLNTDYTGYKGITLLKSLIGQNMKNDTQFANGLITIKYDGKILKEDSLSNGSDIINIAASTISLNMSVADTDTGWAESINPNKDELKAFINGWKALGNDGARYTAWCNILDGTYPYNTSKTSGTTTTAQNKINVLDGSQFIVGRKFWVLNVNGGRDVYTISSISGNQLTLSYNVATSITDQTPILMCDDSSSDTRLLTWCKNNVAQNYEGYQLHYKLQNPEPITDDNCHIHGDIPKFDVGDNYLFLDSGGVIGELANPVIDTSNYDINVNGGVYPTVKGSEFKYKAESVISIYKKMIYDMNNWTVYATPNAYGKVWCNIANTNFDSNATYTVDYKILATQAPQIGSIGCSYSQDISSTINNLQEDVNNKQNHDSILDEIVDLSLYENVSLSYFPSWYNAGGSIWFDIIIPIVPKKVRPTIKISNLTVYSGGSTNNDITNKCSLYGATLIPNKSFIRLTFIIVDSTTITNVKSYGLQIAPVTVIVDCRDRI